MTVERFIYSLHLEQMRVLLASRDMDIRIAEDLPNFGFIVQSSDGPIAAGFIRTIEGGYAMFDSFISNSNRDGLTRDFALDMITTKLIELCKMIDIRSIMAFSKDPNTIARAEDHGLKTILEHKFQIMDIK